LASGLITYPDDATYEANEQGAPVEGNIYFNETTKLIRYYNGTSWIDLVDDESVQTLVNKSIDADNNTITNLEDDNIKAGAAINAEKISGGNVDNTEFDYLNGVTSPIQTQLNNKIDTSEKGAANGVATLDSASKIPSSQIPPVALSEVFVVADNTARDALTVQEGDIALTNDSGKWWIYDGTSWLEMTTPAAVTSVNGQTGAVNLGINDLSDVDTTTTSPSTNDVLTWTGTEWEPVAPGDAFEAVTTKSSTSSLLVTDEVVLCDTSGGAFTLNLPTAVGISGKKYRIKKITTDFDAVTIDPDGSETIDGETTTTINTDGETIVLISDGSNWQILERNIPSKWTSYDPALSGYGTPTGKQFYWKRIGDSMVVKGRFQAGSVAGTTAAVDLPGTLTVANAFITSEFNAGQYTRDISSSGANKGYVILEDGQSEINFSARGDNNPLVRAAANATVDTLETMAIYTTPFPIEGWKG